ncbi:GNAT family N-acetyltransferase [Acinetobacter sp. c3-l95]|uniref:GNAT family N-acetyltransferase n=1 Tax=Acinetobacter sp. c3-l95 TaxID=3342804 RepID=UPI0035B87941
MFELLQAGHNKNAFDCGNDAINHYLSHMASQHMKKGISQVHVLTDDNQIQGFFTLSSISLDNSENLIKGYPKQIPSILIGRLAIDKNQQGKGLSNRLISEALYLTKQISLIVGLAFIVIDAKNDDLANYYERLGFYRLPNQLRLLYPVNQI